MDLGAGAEVRAALLAARQPRTHVLAVVPVLGGHAARARVAAGDAVVPGVPGGLLCVVDETRSPTLQALRRGTTRFDLGIAVTAFDTLAAMLDSREAFDAAVIAVAELARVTLVELPLPSGVGVPQRDQNVLAWYRGTLSPHKLLVEALRGSEMAVTIQE